MGMGNSTRSDESDLEQLATRVDEMIHLCERLLHENASLRKRQGTLIAERAGLIEKTEQARNRVGLMIERLKGMEEES